jgi:hypothetical protein
VGEPEKLCAGPRDLLRLELVPLVCFEQVTAISIRTLLRVERRGLRERTGASGREENQPPTGSVARVIRETSIRSIAHGAAKFDWPCDQFLRHRVHWPFWCRRIWRKGNVKGFLSFPRGAKDGPTGDGTHPALFSCSEGVQFSSRDFRTLVCLEVKLL